MLRLLLAVEKELSAEKMLHAAKYFAHPYSFWERGLNENNNGLIRQYFPKDMQLSDVTQEQVKRATEGLNHRPRKVMGFRSPNEILFRVEMNYTNPSIAVAL
ncbi:MAG: IS30 family transposase [Candidatus Nitrotoga sp.]